MLYDSDPDQNVSLYLRSGLCFTCQRVLNEKRRTARKRKGDVAQTPSDRHHGMDGSEMHQLPGSGGGGMGMADHHHYQIEKRFRLDGEILDLNPDAIIINGPLDDTKHHGPGYEYPEIGMDLQKITQEVSQDTCALNNTIASLHEMPHSSSNENAHILAMYEKTFVSMSKGIFLLNQWKLSWDAAIGDHHEDLNGHGISDAVASADVVASAAAVAAAQSAVSTGMPGTGGGDVDQNSSNMIPMLLASNQRDDDDDGGDEDEDGDNENDDDHPKVFGV